MMAAEFGAVTRIFPAVSAMNSLWFAPAMTNSPASVAPTAVAL